jgi:hypothetical protein
MLIIKHKTLSKQNVGIQTAHKKFRPLNCSLSYFLIVLSISLSTSVTGGEGNFFNCVHTTNELTIQCYNQKFKVTSTKVHHWVRSQNAEVVKLTRLLHILEAFGSNLNPDTGYRDLVRFLALFWLPPGKCLHSVSS